jgi:hypothetical protein
MLENGCEKLIIIQRGCARHFMSYYLFLLGHGVKGTRYVLEIEKRNNEGGDKERLKGCI